MDDDNQEEPQEVKSDGVDFRRHGADRLKHWTSLNDLGANVPDRCSAGRLWFFICLALVAQCGQGPNTELKEKNPLYYLKTIQC